VLANNNFDVGDYETTIRILEHSSIQGYQIGKSKVRLVYMVTGSKVNDKVLK